MGPAGRSANRARPRRRRRVHQQHPGPARPRGHRTHPHKDRHGQVHELLRQRDAVLSDRARAVELEHDHCALGDGLIEVRLEVPHEWPVDRPLDLDDIYSIRGSVGRLRLGRGRQGEGHDERKEKGPGTGHARPIGPKTGVSSEGTPLTEDQMRTHPAPAHAPSEPPGPLSDRWAFKPVAFLRSDAMLLGTAGVLALFRSRRRSSPPGSGSRSSRTASTQRARTSPGSRACRSAPRSSRATARRSWPTSTWTTARSCR